MRSTATLASAAVLATALGVAAASGASAAPPGPSCGDTVTGEVHLTRDLHCTDVGLVLAPGAVLDLDGHTLRGPGTAGGWALPTDVENDRPETVTVRDGRITGWQQVLGADPGALDVVLEELVLDHNRTVVFGTSVVVHVTDSRFADNETAMNVLGGFAGVTGSEFVRNAIGVSVGPFGAESEVSGSVFVDNALALGCSEGGVTVEATTFRRNTTGIGSDWCATSVTGSTFTDNATGVRTRMVSPTFQGLIDTISQNVLVRNDVAADLGVGATVQDNVLHHNAQALVSETAGFATEVEEMVVVGNVSHHNAGDGIRIDTRVELGDNSANHNGGNGIDAPHPGTVDLGGNRARGNGTEPQCVGVVCTPGS